MTASVAACRIDRLSVAYGITPVLTDVSLTVDPGVIMGLVGPNGAGKSTLLKAALGLVTPVAGGVKFLGEPLDRVRPHVAYMPQTVSVDWDFPVRVRDVALMGTYPGLAWWRRPGTSHRTRAQTALERVGLSDLASRQIGALSGGQRQRVFLARALAQDPQVLLMDEPFQGVDITSQHMILQVLHEFRDQGRTVVLVHHDLATVHAHCDEVALLDHRVIATGAVSSTLTAQNVAAAYGPGAAASALGVCTEGVRS